MHFEYLWEEAEKLASQLDLDKKSDNDLSKDLFSELLQLEKNPGEAITKIVFLSCVLTKKHNINIAQTLYKHIEGLKIDNYE